ncbi:thermonuclease family protein [Mesomycoplasma bovoculi]|uniref:Lipoprotein, nuclease family n=1 Tax=Mesomycoplasma bovoculi M165/69 TaxID=743966 RepID=W5UUP4_9BACT|nr:thermonuclease family protein [Mesomycoplasma bovoculi]AHH45535.1 lipoprotein, nuclease family [Mesomycoplasma bovoculi M165/69]
MFVWKKLLLVSATITPIVALASCGLNYASAQKYYQVESFQDNPFADIQNKNSNYYKEVQKFFDTNYVWTNADKQMYKNDKLPNLKYFSVFEAKLVSWTDGDTAKVQTTGKLEFDAKTQKYKTIKEKEPQFPEPISVRFETIDTAETTFVDKDTGKRKPTTGLEYKYAEQAKEFAKLLIPIGSTVYFVFSGESPKGSYNRKVGNIYFGHDGFYKNYNIEIIKAGLALPIISDLANVNINTSVDFYTSIKQSASLENAINKKYGMFAELKGLDFKSISTVVESIYQTRGGSSISQFLKLDNNKDENVIDYYEFALNQHEKEEQ